ncbi:MULTISPECIES: stalk domain-containing protein [Paenibacillus]|uniref:stalk domain-containing protein n=1 Tax=Paenibacillus TaxID=44249 RepID=UPI0022B8BFF0|nr:stalk domain-containing protein [Paenibacillus caseinilyticus]MCZ8518011.1 stalk domain-containing protein [Paenibacillus caseinilyticus]
MRFKAKQWMAVCLLSALVGGSTGSAEAASSWSGGLRGEGGRLLTDVATAAGTGRLGSAGGRPTAASFRVPAGLAVLPDGTAAVSDSRNHVIRRWTPDGVADLAGVLYRMDDKGYPAGGLLDGERDASLFEEPLGLSAGGDGSLYVADAGNHAIRRIDPKGRVTTVAGSGRIGAKDGRGAAAEFYRPGDVAAAADGTLYVADTLGHTIRRISPEGEVTTLTARSGRVVEATPGQAAAAGDYADGPLTEAKFNEPSGIALDARGNLYVSDSGNQRIRYIDLAQGTVTTVAGGGTAALLRDPYVPGGFADGPALQARLNYPMGIAVTSEGGLLIADSQNHAVRYLLDGQLSTLAGAAGQKSGGVDGIEGYASFSRPSDVAVLGDGRVLVADSFNNKLRLLSGYRLPAGMSEGDEPKVALDGGWMRFDAPPEITDGRLMVPVRAVTEALGYEVAFEAVARTVKLTRDGESVELDVGRTGIRRYAGAALLKEKPTDAAPYIKNDLTYVPVRFFAEEIGLDVQWDAASRTAILRRPEHSAKAAAS